MANQHSSSSNTVVVMVPFPAQSHLNQLLQLSHIISSYNIQVHYVASELNLSQVKSRATATHQTPNANLHFHGFPTPPFSSPKPTTTGFPSHLMPSYEASVHLREPVKSLLNSLSLEATRVVVIHDTLMSYVVQDAASLPNVEAYYFSCVSAVFRYAFLLVDLGLANDRDFDGIISPEFQDFLERHSVYRQMNKKSGVLQNTSRVLEGQFLDLILEKEREIDADADSKLWAVGPLETVTISKSKPREALKSSYCLEWLDKQEQSSVLYVSFGTTTFMTDDQIRELAVGLEQSGAKFIWVLRDADKGDVFDETDVRRPQLPHGFEERVEGRGLIVREWAPQLEILGHSSTGGFMSHCGWNSCLESLSLGVPLAAWPMHSDQPQNALLVTQILKAGLFVREWAKRDELVSSSVICDVVKRLMNSEQGNKIRKRAEELGYELRKCTEEGGASRLELDSFVAHITRT